MAFSVVLSAGGTGGHVFPAQALAERLTTAGYDITFVTDRRGNSFSDKFPECSEIRVFAKGYAGKGLSGKISALFFLGVGTMQCVVRFLIRRPSAVVGFGGYAAFPACLAAIALKIPLILHEQNSVLGGANRFLGKHAALIATSFEKVARLPAHVPTVHTGLPLRPDLLALKDLPYPALTPPYFLLITGGSQGARIFADVIPEALKRLPEPLKSRLKIAHQCRADDLDRVNAAYKDSGLDVETAAFFKDMPERLKKAHLMICRAGASSIAELEISGRPAIIVPIYVSPDAHQLHNAQTAVDAGGAVLIEEPDFTPENLAKTISGLFDDEKRLITASAALKSLSRPDAADLLAQAVDKTVKEKTS